MITAQCSENCQSDGYGQLIMPTTIDLFQRCPQTLDVYETVERIDFFRDMEGLRLTEMRRGIRSEPQNGATR
jgi:hypothetical protein